MGRALGVSSRKEADSGRNGLCTHSWIAQPPCQEGKMSAAHPIPATSGRLILVEVVMRAFVLLGLEGDI